MAITGTVAVEELLAVANSYHQPEARDEDSGAGNEFLPAHDHLATADDAVEYFRRKGIPRVERPSARQLAALKEIREAALSLVTNRRAYQRRTAFLLRGVEFELGVDGRLRSRRGGLDGFIDVLLIALVELQDQADRLKLCANDQCGWLFLDRSKNRSRQWCESATCGNRQRVRRFRGGA